MNRIALAAAAGVAALTATQAQAADFSFSGTLTDPNQLAAFTFTVNASQLVILQTKSYAGGTNAAGQTFAAGGFDPILSIYDKSGEKVFENDDGENAVIADPSNNNRFDSFIYTNLFKGVYRAVLSAYPNFGPENLGTGTFGNNGTFGGRTGNYALDITGVDSAMRTAVPNVPEPATWGMMLLGFGVLGGALRRRATVRKPGVSFE